MPVNPLITNNFIDSCAFDPKYHPEDIAAAEIFKLHKEIELPIQIAHSTQKEIEHPNTPSWIKREAQKLIYTIKVSLTSIEQKHLHEIQNILAGSGKVENILQDAQHIFEAQKYGSYFVTTDSRILNRAAALRAACSVTILRPSEFLSIVKQHLNKECKNKNNKYHHSPSIQHRGGMKTQNEPIKNKCSYKGYLIEAVPYKLAVSGEWTMDINIWRDTGSQVNIQHFSAANTLKTEKEAIYHCLILGKKIIDGEIENCTVQDL